MIQKILLLLFFCITNPLFAEAGTLSLSSTQTDLTVGDVFFVDVLLDTSDETINAVEVEVAYPSDLVSFIKSEQKNSFVSLWIAKPSVVESGLLQFSGVTPGGVQGEKLMISRLFFKTLAEGQSPLSVSSQSVLLHDGLGTQATIDIEGVHITIEAGDATLTERPYTDAEPPEAFVPVRTRDNDLFGGKYFLVFDTQDKDSGIESYMVREGIFDWYKEARSPYELQHQTDDRVLFVKAIDKAGNAVVAKVYPQSGVVWYQKLSVLFSILIVFSSLCLLLFLYKLVRGRK